MDFHATRKKGYFDRGTHFGHSHQTKLLLFSMKANLWHHFHCAMQTDIDRSTHCKVPGVMKQVQVHIVEWLTEHELLVIYKKIKYKAHHFLIDFVDFTGVNRDEISSPVGGIPHIALLDLCSKVYAITWFFFFLGIFLRRVWLHYYLIRGVRGIFFRGYKVIFPDFFPGMKCFFSVENFHFGRPKTNFGGFEKVLSSLCN